MPPPLDIPDEEDVGQDFRPPAQEPPAPPPAPASAPIPGNPPPAPMISTIQRPQQSVRVPPQGFNDPNWQRQAEQQQMEIYKRAQSVDQAMKDVGAARRMLGILKADREIKSGVPVDKALYNNLNYFVQPADKNFTPAFKALQPPPMPQATSFPGTTLPPGVQMGNKFMWPSAAAIKATTPPAENLPKIIDLDGEKYVVNPHTGHFERKDKNKIVSVLTPSQMGQQLVSRARIIQNELKAGPDDKTAKALQGELNDVKQQLSGLTQPKPMAPPAPTAPVTDRVRVRSKDGKVGTIPKSQLEEAQKAGYSVVQ